MDESRDILRKALDSALAIYRLTERLPKGEIMISQLRKLGNEVVGDLMMDKFFNAQKKIELLLVYFKISRAQKWVREVNWLILSSEYQKLNQEIIFFAQAGDLEERTEIRKRIAGVEKTEDLMSHNIEKVKKIKKVSLRVSKLSSRQQKILEELKEKESIKMSDLTPLFKNTASERTIRNDLQILLKKGLIDRTGAHKTTLYFLR